MYLVHIISKERDLGSLAIKRRRGSIIIEAQQKAAAVARGCLGTVSVTCVM